MGLQGSVTHTDQDGDKYRAEASVMGGAGPTRGSVGTSFESTSGAYIRANSSFGGGKPNHAVMFGFTRKF